MPKLKDSKLGKWLKDKAPKVLDIVGDVLPDKGVLGIVKNIISNDPDIPAEDKLEFEQMLLSHEKEMFELEVQDRTSARLREVDFVKATGHMDYLMWFLAISIVVVFSYLVYSVIHDTVPEENRELIFHIFGIVEGVLLSVFGYYFGSSASSRVKEMKR